MADISSDKQMPELEAAARLMWAETGLEMISIYQSTGGFGEYIPMEADVVRGRRMAIRYASEEDMARARQLLEAALALPGPTPAA